MAVEQMNVTGSSFIFDSASQFLNLTAFSHGRGLALVCCFMQGNYCTVDPLRFMLGILLTT